MYEPVQQCKSCGAGLTLEHLRGTNCPYCNTVFPHHAQAAQHAMVANQVMNQMMAQQAQVQAQWRGAYGVGPMPPQGLPGGPPPAGFPYSPQGPYAHPNNIAQVHAMQSAQLGRSITMMVFGITIGVLVLVGVIVAFVIVR